MTIRFLKPWNGYQPDQVATLAGGVETALINGGIAVANTAQGSDQIIKFSTASGTVTDSAARSAIAEAAASGAVFVPAMPTTEAIIAAAQAARDAGGGEVEISGIALTLTQPLPFYDNVVYVGNNVSFNMFGSILMSGTILTGNGTFNAFECNNIDRASAQTYAAFTAEFIKNAGVKRVGVKNCLNGIRVGGKYTAGISEIIIEDFHATGCAEWGMWIENAHNGSIARCRLDLNANVAAFVASGGSALNTGNYSVNEVKGNPLTQKGRGLWYHIRGAGSSMNDVHTWMCSATGKAPGQSTQTATLTNGTANIAVTDLSKYALGMGVVFDSTVGNFSGGAQETSTRRAYFVVAMSGATGAGTIQLSLRIAGSVQTPSASGSATIRTAGMSLYELSTELADGSQKFTHCSHKAMDIEAQGTASLYISDTTNVIVEPGILPGLPESIHQIVGRNCDYSFDLKVFQRISSIDFDSERWTFHGVEPAAVVGNIGIGLHYNFGTTRAGISIFGTKGGDIKGNNANTIQFTYPISVSGTPQNSGHTINSNSGQVITYTGVDGGNLTMIAMNDERKGVTYTISNPTAGAVTVNGGGINFVGLGTSAASFSLAANTNAQVMGAKTGSTYYWARIS